MSKAPEVMDKLREYIATLPEDMTFVQDLRKHSEDSSISEEMRLKLFSVQCNRNEFMIVMLAELVKNGEDSDPRSKVIVGWDNYFRNIINTMMTDDDRNEIDQIVGLEASYILAADKENN